jgi:hypothetical protein
MFFRTDKKWLELGTKTKNASHPKNVYTVLVVILLFTRATYTIKKSCLPFALLLKLFLITIKYLLPAPPFPYLRKFVVNFHSFPRPKLFPVLIQILNFHPPPRRMLLFISLVFPLRHMPKLFAPPRPFTNFSA